ncbi:cytochrome P450 [Catellatospora sp. TT07R-123]|uniref:cytochrome P450 family protein n=1 Tax=Catellatospora sp. TT07R-123 TaxID=2733863 RepID=UPI001B16533E|nr:cytochrome P450 [Catellatospora sp. TT07R-123]GHJ43151.1 cytochrome P450 [Catellatospora sp. TT07R-123]
MAQQRTLGDGDSVWTVSGYDQVRDALGDPRLSLDKANATNYTGLRLPAVFGRNLLNMDPPDHTRIRALVGQAFTPRTVDKLRPFIENTAAELAATLADGADLIGFYAAPLSLTVIGELLGVPGEARSRFRSWTSTLLAPKDRADAAHAMGAMQDFLTDLVHRLREEPAEGLLSELVEAHDHGDRLSEDELVSLAFLLLWAGYENTVNLIGNTVHALLTHPRQLADVRADPGLIPAAVEETLRWNAPAPSAIRRFPMEDVDLDGTTIPAGATVLLSLADAGRDPDRYADAEDYLLHRTDGGNLSLGRGIHYCVGAPLARLEAEVAVSVLLDAAPGLALAVPEVELRWTGGHRTRGLLQLPVTL